MSHGINHLCLTLQLWLCPVSVSIKYEDGWLQQLKLFLASWWIYEGTTFRYWLAKSSKMLNIWVYQFWYLCYVPKQFYLWKKCLFTREVIINPHYVIIFPLLLLKACSRFPNAAVVICHFIALSHRCLFSSFLVRQAVPCFSHLRWVWFSGFCGRLVHEDSVVFSFFLF